MSTREPTGARSSGDALGPVRPLRPALVALLLLGACSSTPEALLALKDAALQQALLGTWCNSTDGGRSCWAYDQFAPDGSLRACGRHDDEALPFDGSGVVSVNGDRMCYEVTRATANFWARAGSRYCTRIIGISRSTHVYEDLESGARFTLYRRSGIGAPCPDVPP
jgi:hypothetical protein